MLALTRRYRMLLGVVAAGLVVVAGGVYLVLGVWLRDTSTELPVPEVVETFRDEEGGNAAVPGEGLPAAGVYLYGTEGSEEVDALGGTRHQYPAETTVTVVAAGCGVELRWDALKERYESWRLCRAGDAITQPGYASYHRFFGQPDLKEFTCEEGSMMLPADPEVGVRWETDCAAGSLREVTRYEVVELAELEVGGKAVPAVRVKLTVDVSGSSKGSTEGEMWIARDSGLPLRWRETTTTVTGSAIGPVRYSESLSIVLTKLVPQR